MEPITSQTRKAETISQGTGQLGKKTVSQEDLSKVRSRLKISCDHINKLDIGRKSIGQRVFESCSEFIRGVSEEKKKKFEAAKETLKSQELNLNDSDLKSIKHKLDNNEYLDPQEAKLLKKKLLIKNQERIGVQDAADKTEAFYRFDTVIESKTKESFNLFKQQIEKLKLQGLESTLSFVEGKVKGQKDFDSAEITMVRDAIFNALKTKRAKSDNELAMQEVKKQQDFQTQVNRGLNEENKKLNEQNQVLKQNNVNFDDKARTQEQQLNEVRQHHTELQRNANELRRENQSLQGENTRLLKEMSHFINMESEYKLLKKRTQNYDEINSELISIKNTIENLNAKKEELEQLNLKLNEAEQVLEVNQKKGQEMQAAVNEKTRELKDIESSQEEIMKKIQDATVSLILLGQVLGAQAATAMPEELRDTYNVLNLSETAKAIELLNKESELTGEEVQQLKQLTYTMIQELEYENSLRKDVPKEMRNLRSEFELANDTQSYLKDLKQIIIADDYPALVASDDNPRVFVFFVEGDLIKIEINTADDMNKLQEALDLCRHRAEVYKRVEEAV